MGKSLARRLADADETVILAGRDRARALEVAKEIGEGVTADTPSAAVAAADVVFLAVPYPEVATVIAGAGDLSGKVVVDLTNPMARDLMLAVGHTTSAAEEIQKLAPAAKVIKAFNTIFSALLDLDYGPDDIPPQVIYAGDDEPAKRRVAGLIEAIGFQPLDGGPLRNARFIEPIGGLIVQFGYALGRGTRVAPRFVEY
jgi:predicted dinucleotide-binding enzyme